jgi:hypothetical protein
VIKIATDRLIGREASLEAKLRELLNADGIERVISSCCASFKTRFADSDDIGRDVCYSSRADLQLVVDTQLQDDEDNFLKVVEGNLHGCGIPSHTSKDEVGWSWNYFERLLSPGMHKSIWMQITSTNISGETRSVEVFDVAGHHGTGSLKMELQRLWQCPQGKQIHISMRNAPNRRVKMESEGELSVLDAMRERGLETYSVTRRVDGGYNIAEPLELDVAICPFQRKNTAYERGRQRGVRRMAYNMSDVAPWDSGEEVDSP